MIDNDRLSTTMQEMRPKFLVQYVNLTDEDKKNINAEFEELKNLAPKYDQSTENFTNLLLDRYNNIPSRGPWNETAVHLTGNHRTHDYINANEIRGVNSNKEYIACQGPLKNTCQDFWDMIIQYRVTKIIMLSKFQQEKHSQPNKCYSYIPMNKGQSLSYGRIKIKVTNIEFYLDNQLEIRHLIVKEVKNEFHIIHYLFTGWSAFNVIESRKLIDLIETINQYSTNLSIPIVVHCSSGTGRTGTYIAVDRIIHLLDQSNNELSKMKLDIMSIVNQLKHDRINMVQTSEQYLLIYHCVEEYLRRTNRLDIILRELNAYEIIRDEIPSSIDNRYIDLSKSKHSSYLDSQSIITNLETISIPQTINTEQKINDDQQIHKYYYLQNENENSKDEPPSSRQTTTDQFQYLDNPESI